MLNLCTLFDKNYLDRGIALFRSLRNCCDDFRLYVMTFDDECYDLLSNKYQEMIVCNISEMECTYSDLYEAKKTRSRRAYCWTCSSWTIKFFMEKYKLDCCTYVDADEYYYSNPQFLIDDFLKSGKDVGIIGHHYGNNKYAERMIKGSGTYCVQFNSFRNTLNGQKVLDKWCRDCLENCVEQSDGKAFGDQMYLETWPEEYDCIYIYEQLGAGIAPWNFYRYRKSSKGDKYLYDKLSKENVLIVFAHFHNLVLQDGYADINVFTRYGRHERNLIIDMYKKYIKELREINTERNLVDRNKDSHNNEMLPKYSKKSYADKIATFGLFEAISGSVKFRVCKQWDYIIYD